MALWGGMAGGRRDMSDGRTYPRPLLGRYALDGVIRARVHKIAPAWVEIDRDGAQKGRFDAIMALSERPDGRFLCSDRPGSYQ